MASAAGSPDSTVERGPLFTATESSGTPATACSACSSESSTTAISPLPLMVRISSLRRQITAAASFSESAPAMCVAATSPMLWPTTALGTTPQLCQSSARETPTAKSMGCTTSMRASWELASSALSSASTDQPVSAWMAASQRLMDSAKTGWEAISSRPMPSHWEPWPGKTKTTEDSIEVLARPCTAAGWPWLSEASEASRPALEVSTRATRSSKWSREVARLCARERKSRSGWASRCSPSRAACWDRAASLRADSTSSSASRAGGPPNPSRSP